MFAPPILEPYRKTQGFAQTLLDYSKFGMKGHNGIDLACNRGVAVYAVDDGLVVLSEGGQKAGDTSGYGNRVVLFVSLDRPNAFYDVIYGHLLSVVVQQSQTVKKGQLLGFVDSTGFSSGDHLHFGVRVVERRKANPGEMQISFLNSPYVVLNYNNGYLGYIDPEPLFSDNIADLLPVDLRYGSQENKAKEAFWAFRYNETKVRQDAYAKGFGNKEFERMKKAFVYGYWDRQFIFDSVGNFPVWASMTKIEYQDRIKRGTLAGSAPLTVDPR